MRIAGVELFCCHPRRDAALGLATWAEEVECEAMVRALVSGGIICLFAYLVPVMGKSIDVFLLCLITCTV